MTDISESPANPLFTQKWAKANREKNRPVCAEEQCSYVPSSFLYSQELQVCSPNLVGSSLFTKMVFLDVKSTRHLEQGSNNKHHVATRACRFSLLLLTVTQNRKILYNYNIDRKLPWMNTQSKQSKFDISCQ